ncbi:MAG: carbohydrate ABC transporter permease [Chloroflexota bacterium]|nr:carbohydrate ABC transporter permease [Chloroflexota bacterium]MDE2951938.1 carbohydrate ABC transporter permease [Chloroflexota bacterium]
MRKGLQDRNTTAFSMTGGGGDWIRRLGTGLLYAALTIMLILFMAPVYGAIATAFKSQAEVAAGGYWTPPSNLAGENFARVMDPEQGNLGLYLGNSLLLTIPASIFSIALGTLAGYGLGKYNFRGDGLLFIFIVAGMFLPPQIALIPVFRLMNDIGLYDTIYAVIIIHTAFGIPICTLVMRNFFQIVPNALREAALIDGANEYKIFFRIMLPLTLPALAVLATLQFTWIWNDFLWPFILTQKADSRTIMVGILNLTGQYTVDWGGQAAASLIGSLPTLFIFVFFQRYFIRGLTLGAVKG